MGASHVLWSGRPAGQRDQFPGIEQALPKPEPLKASGELRRPADAARRLRIVDAGRQPRRCPVLPRLPGLRGRASRKAPASGIAGSRFKRSGYRWLKAGANAPPAVKCCIGNNRWADFLNWQVCRAAAA